MPKSSRVKKATTMTKEEVMAMTMVEVAMMMQAMKTKTKVESREKVGEECQTLIDNILIGYYIPAMLALATTHVVAQLYKPYDMLYLHLVWNLYFYYFHCVCLPLLGI